MPTDPKPLDIATLVPAADWAGLPAEVRHRFAPGHATATYRGALTTTSSWMGWIFSRLSAPLGGPLPRCAGADIATEVRVFADGKGGVVWERWLFPPGRPACRVRSTKAIGRGGRLEEKTGAGLGMVLDVFVENRALVFQSRYYFIDLFGTFRVIVPSWLTPGRCRVSHEAVSPDIFRFTLAFRHRWFGVALTQRGLFVDPAAAQTLGLAA